MKILSKYKDYYDYLQGIKGMDEKLILDRTKGTVLSPSSFAEAPTDRWIPYSDHYPLIICGIRYDIVNYKGSLIELKTYFKVKSEEGGKYRDDYREKYENFSRLTVENPEYPIYLRSFSISTPFPKLENLGIPTVLPAEELWNMLYNYLSKDVDITHVQTNEDKIVSHGFDLKTSFRPKIKYEPGKN